MTASYSSHPTTARAAAPSSPRRMRYVALGLLLASIALAGAVLPFVWDALATINAMPKMGWLSDVLARMPATSWVLMLVWGSAVPLAVLYGLSPSGRGWHSAAWVAVLSLWAVTWYVHMPALSECRSSGVDASLCGSLQWLYSLSLGLGTSLYIFAVFLLGVCSVCMATDKDDSPKP